MKLCNVLTIATVLLCLFAIMLVLLLVMRTRQMVHDIPPHAITQLFVATNVVPADPSPRVVVSDQTVPLLTIAAPTDLVPDGHQTVVDLTFVARVDGETPLAAEGMDILVDKKQALHPVVLPVGNDGLSVQVGWSGVLVFPHDAANTSHVLSLRFPHADACGTSVVVLPVDAPGGNSFYRLCVTRA